MTPGIKRQSCWRSNRLFVRSLNSTDTKCRRWRGRQSFRFVTRSRSVDHNLNVSEVAVDDEL